MNRKMNLRELSETVLQELERLNYAYNTICGFRASFNRIIKFADSEGLEFFSEEFGLKYLLERYNCTVKSITEKQPHNAKQAFRSIRLLGDYQLHNIILRRIVKMKGYKKPEQFTALLNAYEEECTRNEYSKRGMRSRLQRLFFFIDYLNERNVQDINEVNAQLISDYIKTICHKHEKSMSAILTTLRVFLKFAYLNEYISTDQSLNIPSYTKHYYPKIPSTWKNEDVIKLLKAVDRGSPVGKRDYAILLIVAKLGMRVGDLKALKLVNLNWKKQEISFIQEKTKNPITLPILDDIGWALIDYLKYGRPEFCTSPYLFVRLNAPYECFGKDANLYNIISKYVRIAAIEVSRDSRRGLHSLRHSLASGLLEQGATLNEISNILGHTSTKSTSLYLRLDEEKLALCALDPEEVLRNE
jgi:site-specific recombinase XerD